MKVLITGVTGFAGSHLADHLIEAGHEVWGLRRWRSRDDNVAHLAGRLRLIEGDITDARAMADTIAAVRPAWIFHLAAQSFVPASWQAPDATLTTNIRGQLNLLEAVRAARLTCRIQIAGSSEEYGLVQPHELPITEDTPLRPLSPYAVSKVAQDLLAWQYARSYGLDVVRTRGFNHTGPRRGEPFVSSDFARQVAEVSLGLREPVIAVGNLEARRDFTDVRDVARAYALALERGKSAEVYNICSGQDVSIRELLGMLADLAGVEVATRPDPARLRPSDVPVLRGCCDKFRKATGWEPRLPLRTTLADLLAWWRQRLVGPIADARH